jgi:hypothetical protein
MGLQFKIISIISIETFKEQQKYFVMNINLA